MLVIHQSKKQDANNEGNNNFIYNTDITIQNISTSTPMNTIIRDHDSYKNQTQANFKMELNII